MFKIILIIILTIFLIRAIFRALVGYLILRTINKPTPQQKEQDQNTIADLHPCSSCGKYIPMNEKCDCKS